MKISFLGAVRSVTGSMHLLEVNGSRILLECGLFQGRRQEAFERNRHLPFDASALSIMVLSHAHIDHSGNIPNLVRSGFRQRIHCTHATRDLCGVMLRDSGHIMESDAQYLNKKRQRQNLPPIEPLYTSEDALRSLRGFTSSDYGLENDLVPGVKLTFADAGHILGSALCVLDIVEGGRKLRLLFTGDLGRTGMPILRDPETVPDVDYLITESTYGARLHGTVQDAESELRGVVNETFSRGGKLIVPAFSVGRTQEIVYALHRLGTAGEIPRLPIYVDSPLSTDATEVFRLHPECYDAETLAFVQKYRDPFGWSQLHYVRDAEESKALNWQDEPMVIISASGMCESGRILHHLKNNIENSRNTVLLVGFQAENTLGRRIQERSSQVSILGEMHPVKARIVEIHGYSAHADRNELLSYIQKISSPRLKKTFIVHGDEEASLALQKGLQEAGLAETYVPCQGEQVTI
jgi:metallo-beta-lactamase family protein